MKFPVLLLLCFSVHNLAAQQEKKLALDKYFTALYNGGVFNGNVLVAENGKIIYRRSFGYADFAAQAPNAENTSFAVASITKTMTAIAILQLQEKGKLSIDDTYSRYFPLFPYATVTVRQLLSHTSLIPSSAFYRFLDSLRKTKDTFFVNNDVIPALGAMKKGLLSPQGDGPRASFAYSNVNYYLLALLIEKLSGMPYQGYIRKYIFSPAGMEQSGFSEFYFGSDKKQCIEHKYRYKYEDKPLRIDTMGENLYIFSTYNLKGHGDVVSTTGDLLKYDQALYDGRLLKQPSLALAFHAEVTGLSGQSGYGLGWSVWPDSSRGKVVLHHGGGIGIEAMFVRNISRHQTIILFDNTKNSAFNPAMNALKILNGDKVSTPGKNGARQYGKIIVSEGIAAAQKFLERVKNDTLHYTFTEDDMNVLAYQLMWNKMDDKALEVFKTNLQMFPDSWNSYDSYGEILLKLGRKEEAISMYKKSIEMNPGNEGGKKVLADLGIK